MLEQDEIRRRIIAAKTLADHISTWAQLAEATKIGESTLKGLGTPRGRADEKHLRVIAAACALPYAWFTVEDLGRAVSREDEDPALVERVEALEHTVAALVRRDGLTPPPPAPRDGGDPPPAPGGELGRRLRGRATKSAGPGRPDSAPEEGSAPKSAG
ncbi:hypothetical protein [Baekduia sp.]|uniref:hypothetical protein n=1 Tax=Baekduia sp. TaxID=2600305 RepID=UPI002E08008A|nr:hypothetical protein [Baekduia sp.]